MRCERRRAKGPPANIPSCWSFGSDIRCEPAASWDANVKSAPLGPHAVRRRNARYQKLVDPPPVEIDHLETPAVDLVAFAGLRNMPELRPREPGRSVEIAVGIEWNAEALGKLVDRHRAGDEIGSIRPLDHVRVILAAEFPDDRLEDVRGRHHAEKL